MLMAGENPAHSAAMVAAAGKLFGMHLNDGHSRVGAEDGWAHAQRDDGGLGERVRAWTTPGAPAGAAAPGGEPQRSGACLVTGLLQSTAWPLPRG
jgi:hypothetical protein